MVEIENIKKAIPSEQLDIVGIIYSYLKDIGLSLDHLIYYSTLKNILNQQGKLYSNEKLIEILANLDKYEFIGSTKIKSDSIEGRKETPNLYFLRELGIKAGDAYYTKRKIMKEK